MLATVVATKEVQEAATGALEVVTAVLVVGTRERGVAKTLALTPMKTRTVLMLVTQTPKKSIPMVEMPILIITERAL